MIVLAPRAAAPAGTAGGAGLASCLRFYARAGDISATRDVARMSCQPASQDFGGSRGEADVLRRRRPHSLRERVSSASSVAYD